MVPQSVRSILDVGCGDGSVGCALLMQENGREVCGIEYDGGLATQAASRLSHVMQGDLNTMDWKKALGDRRFDCIIFSNVLERLVDPSRCLAEAMQFLVAGGCVVLGMQNIRHISTLHSIYLSDIFPRRDSGIFGSTPQHWFTISDAYRLLEDNNLKVTKMSLVLRWSDIGEGPMSKLLNRLPSRVQAWGPIREFLAHRVCLRAVYRR
ncbi:MAG: class I SAM-dependent methyltransferase [Burkholderiaceae bacterium]|nr:class I SAM-dependent methyltransferase [Burkholderiaceae bacterium]